MNFVAIDFETASSGKNGICSIGICAVTDNKVSEQKEIFVKPDPFEFCEHNIAIHHITPEMVENEPEFSKIWKDFFPYLNDRLVIAHNAEFDIGTLLNTLDHFNIEYPSFDYLCTVKLSQKAYPELKSHKLNAMAEEMEIDFNHHNAGDDAYVCAKILQKIITDFDIKTLSDLEEKFSIGIGHVYPGYHIGCSKNNKQKKIQKSANKAVKSV